MGRCDPSRTLTTPERRARVRSPGMSWWPLCWASSLDRRPGTGCPWPNGGVLGGVGDTAAAHGVAGLHRSLPDVRTAVDLDRCRRVLPELDRSRRHAACNNFKLRVEGALHIQPIGCMFGVCQKQMRTGPMPCSTRCPTERGATSCVACWPASIPSRHWQRSTT